MVAGCGRGPITPPSPAAGVCVARGQWMDPATGRPLAHPEVLARAARARIVLLGERHDVVEDHRWQLDVLAGLAAWRATLVVGLEAFARAAQPALDAWVAGDLSVDELLTATRWRETWSVAPELYLPLLHFTRRHRVPTVALNVDRSLVQRVGQRGWHAIPAAERGGIGDPAPPRPAYRERLLATYAEHVCKPPERVRDTAGFARFVEAQLLWDRAMAEALGRAASAHPQALVVGLAGSGHLEHGDGIPHQLDALGIDDVAVLLPWHVSHDCSTPPPGIADAVFGLGPLAAEAPPPVRHRCEPGGAAAHPPR